MLQRTDAGTTTGLGWAEYLRQWEVHLRARGLATSTIAWYLGLMREAAARLSALGLPEAPAAITREHIEEVLASLREGRAPETLRAYYKALRAFYRWLLDEGEVARHPMERLPWPKVPPRAPRGVTADEVRAMVRACGQDVLGRRDAALVAFLFDTGWRASEALQATVAMAREGTYRALAKGGREVVATLSPRVQELVNRWLRARAQLPGAGLTSALWLGRNGEPLTRHGLYEIVAAAGKRVGLAVHPHMLRHGHAYAWLEAGGDVMDLKENLGHSSVAVTETYLRWQARERALRARERHAPGLGL
ncbi:Tyrosine recombinase XerD [bacterium HR24]|nr:Tyrosine recombinase XerD [bacterium HR24]